MTRKITRISFKKYLRDVVRRILTQICLVCLIARRNANWISKSKQGFNALPAWTEIPEYMGNGQRLPKDFPVKSLIDNQKFQMKPEIENIQAYYLRNQ